MFDAPFPSSDSGKAYEFVNDTCCRLPPFPQVEKEFAAWHNAWFCANEVHCQGYCLYISFDFVNSRTATIGKKPFYPLTNVFPECIFARLNIITMNILKLNSVEEKLITVRGISVILDSDVAELYGVETRDINKSVRNNPGKFPEGYLMELNQNEKIELVENFHRFNRLKHSTVFPTAFTEKGLYMLATILKSPKATQTTIDIVEAFAKIRELSRTLTNITKTTDEAKHKTLLAKSGDLLNDLLFNDLQKVSTECSVVFNLGLMKIKHQTKRERIKPEEQSELKELLYKILRKLEEFK